MVNKSIGIVLLVIKIKLNDKNFLTKNSLSTFVIRPVIAYVMSKLKKLNLKLNVSVCHFYKVINDTYQEFI